MYFNRLLGYIGDRSGERENLSDNRQIVEHFRKITITITYK